MPKPPEKPVLDAQKQHWEGMLESGPEMFGRDPSEPARRTAAELKSSGAQRILELGGGQGRDSLFFAAEGFQVHVLDYAQAGVDAILRNATQAGLRQLTTAAQHDVRRPIPSDDASFDACYSHMLFCMALTTSELTALSREIVRVLRPGGLCTYTVRNTKTGLRAWHPQRRRDVREPGLHRALLRPREGRGTRSRLGARRHRRVRGGQAAAAAVPRDAPKACARLTSKHIANVAPT